ncbi:acetyltransferase/esterase [Stachybotrys elegans]|uniref:Acetyltransferase/esterase n=1 Tax=Stachybotrys elegans TaxID=80388 RepID=A0A8K0WMB7_9HYPO|nr:acetyltransferase/esterase [Stachybotrys elegans]
MDFNPTRAVVHNEGCDIHYWYQGAGPMILFVPGGNGHGRQYNLIMAALSDRFTCVAFDRRGMSASKVQVNTILNPPMQTRDMLAIIKAMGFEKAIIFGNSLGGLLGFVFAHDYPQFVEHLIAHEAPTMNILPNQSEIFEWFLHIRETRATKGWEAAADVFRSLLVGYGPTNDEGHHPRSFTEPENNENFFNNEIDIVALYTPNFHRIKENGTSVGVMAGKASGDALYVRTTVEQAKLLDCPRMVVPGHHGGYESEVEAFVPFFYEMLGILEAKKGAKAE